MSLWAFGERTCTHAHMHMRTCTHTRKGSCPTGHATCACTCAFGPLGPERGVAPRPDNLGSPSGLGPWAMGVGPETGDWSGTTGAQWQRHKRWPSGAGPREDGGTGGSMEPREVEMKRPPGHAGRCVLDGAVTHVGEPEMPPMQEPVIVPPQPGCDCGRASGGGCAEGGPLRECSYCGHEACSEHVRWYLQYEYGLPEATGTWHLICDCCRALPDPGPDDPGSPEATGGDAGPVPRMP